MKNTPPKPKLLAALGAAVVAALTAFVPQSHADPNLTNKLIAYWPMDQILGNVITPDAGANSLDLKPFVANSPVSFNGANITLSANAGPHFGIAGAQNGTNALGIHSAQSTVLGFIYAPTSVADMCTNMILPQLNRPNWTMSFWMKAASGGANSGGATGRFWSAIDTFNGNPLNGFWDFDGGTTAAQMQHFTRQNTSGGGLISGFQFADDNPNGDATASTNNYILDNNWHNVTIIAQTITNTLPLPVIDPTQFGNPSNGFVTITYTNTTLLDSLPINAVNQVDTNQNYQVQISSTAVNGQWTTISQSGGTGAGGTITFTDGTPTNSTAFYRVQRPRIRQRIYTVLLDGTNTLLPTWQPTPKSNGASYRTNGFFYCNTFAFGGFMRSAGEGGFVDSLYSDAAVWDRSLSTGEVASYIKDGITNASALQPALFANISAENLAVAQGDTDLLSWSASKPPATLTLNPGNSDVTPLSSLGNGSTNSVVSSNTTFTLTATRSAVSVTGAVSVICVSNIAANWRYVDAFTYDPLGPIAGVASWGNPAHGPATASGLEPMRVYNSLSGNSYASFDGYDTGSGGVGGIAGRALGSLSSTPGNTNSVFFRFYIDPAATNTDPNTAAIDAIQQTFLLSDVGALDAAINGGQFGGPAFTISQPAFGGPIDLTATSANPTGAGLTTSPGGYDYLNDPNTGDTNGLIAGHVYSVWIDLINNFPGVVGGFISGGEQTNAVYYSVWLQRDDWPQRTNLFGSITCTNATVINGNNGTFFGVTYPTGYLLSQRDYSLTNAEQTILGPSPNLRNFEVILSTQANPQPTNAIRFDDVFISKTGTGFNSTVPDTAGSFAP